MDLNFLEFEQPIAELEAKIEELRSSATTTRSTSRRRSSACRRRAALTESSSPAHALADLPARPPPPAALPAGLRRRIFDDFQELHGDRTFADDHAIVGGVARSTGAR
jgi:acetyl-CoA carboxylase carboxyl transferase subunit alpha